MSNEAIHRAGAEPQADHRAMLSLRKGEVR